MEYTKINNPMNDTGDNVIVNEKIKALSELFPEIVKDGEIDFKALKEELGKFEEIGSEKFELTWAGKQNAKKKYLENISNRTLKLLEEESKNPNETENLYIEGDNLEVLKLLRKNYYNSIKMIYIDPPYNTDKDFIYNDSFKMTQEEHNKAEGYVGLDNERLEKVSKTGNRYHANWLNMMYPRLKTARDLLTDDGVIFISIDDNEVDNLKKICNEIFDEDNFIGILSVENNPKGRKNSKFISISSEYCVIYAKNKENSYFIENVPKKSSDMVLDENGNYVHNSGKRVLVGENNFNNEVTNIFSDKNYSVYYSEKNNSLKLLKEKISENNAELLSMGYIKYFSSYNNKLIENTYTEQKFLELFKNRALAFSNQKIYEKNFNDTIRIKSQLINREYEAIIKGKKKNYSMELTTTGAGTMLKNLFNIDNLLFSAPKNIGFLKLLISLIDDKNLIILDFFSGSASTAHAVMQLNAEDGGNRKFIMVQLDELTYDGKKEKYKDEDGEQKERYIIDKETGFPILAKDSDARKNGYYTIPQIGRARIDKAGEKIKKEIEDNNNNLKLGEEPKKVPDIGFKTLKTGDTNIKWNRLTDILNGNLTFAENNDPDSMDFELSTKDIDVVYELMLLQRDLPLSEQAITLDEIGLRTYLYANSYLVCLETQITDEIIEKIANLNPAPIKFFFRDSAFGNDIALKDNIFNKFERIIEKNSITKKKTYTVEFI